MAYSLAQSITEVRSIINEDTASFWTDAQITAWLQQGTLDWCEKSLLYADEDDITLVASQAKYTTSTSSNIDTASRVLHAEYSGKAMQRVSYTQIRAHNARALGSLTTPFYYYDQYFGNALTVFIGPTPAAAQADETVSVIFAMKTTDITDIADEYQPTIFLYAAHKCKVRERQYQEASMFYQQYLANVYFSKADRLVPAVQPVDGYRIK